MGTRHHPWVPPGIFRAPARALHPPGAREWSGAGRDGLPHQGTAQERSWLAPGIPGTPMGSGPPHTLRDTARATPRRCRCHCYCHCHRLIFGTHRLWHPPSAPNPRSLWVGHTHLTLAMCHSSPQPRGQALSLSTAGGDKKPLRKREHPSPNPGTTLRQSRVGVPSLNPLALALGRVHL